MPQTTKVVTGKVRFSYAHVFEPHSVEEGGVKKYSVSLLIPKSDTVTVAKIKAAIELAIVEGTAKHFAGKRPANLKTPLRDGDVERSDDPTYAGHWFVNANSNNKPGLVDENLNDIIDRDEFYSGCYGRASVNFYAFNVSGNRGVACGLNNIQKLEDGEALSGGRGSAAADFGDENDDLL
jgi:Ca2+-binding RTX toxin-like protein